MLALPHTNSWGFIATNQANAATAPGTSVTPGASDVEGSWTEILGDADVTSDLQYIWMSICGGATNGQSKQQLLDFGYDPAGGTSYVAFFQNFACGSTSTFFSRGGAPMQFPCKIPAGSALAVRVQGSNATAGTIRCHVFAYGKPSRPELWRPAAYSETLGYSSGTLGTSFTPGNDSFGSWTSLGTTTKKHFWAQLGVQCDNATVNGRASRFQLGIGDGTNMHVIQNRWTVAATDESMGDLSPPACSWEIPAGAELWVRGATNFAAETGWNATAVLFGG